MRNDMIYKSVCQLVKKSGTNDPFVIAKDKGILVILNHKLQKLKGIYMVIKKNRIITVNSNLTEEEQRIVCAHELGHDIFHRSLAKDRALQEFMLWDMTGRPEYEANIFAAELLLEDREVSELAYEGYDMQSIARMLRTDINLVGLKLAAMNDRGYSFNVGIEPKNNFLKD